MTAKITAMTETMRYKVTTRRYLDGQWVNGTMTATVTHKVENYWDSWLEELVPLGYRVAIYDSMDGATSYCTLTDDTFQKYWVSQAS